jgi:hypothetical protein
MICWQVSGMSRVNDKASGGLEAPLRGFCRKARAVAVACDKPPGEGRKRI